MTTTDGRTLRSGLDLSQRDEAIRPQDDLFGHVNGVWLREHVMPADRSADGEFRRLRDLAEERVREIVEECAADTAASPDSPEGRIGTLYRAFMDEDAIERAGLAPLEPHLARIGAIGEREDLVRHMAAPDSGASVLASYVWTDDRDSTRYQVKLHQAGLGLPDESYYRDPTHAEIRAEYRTHLERLAELADLPGRPGLVEGTAADLAHAVADFETRLAALHVDVVRVRDREKSDNPMDAAALAQLAPAFAWDAYFEGAGAPARAREVVCVGQPEYVEALDELFTVEPLETLRTWLALHTVSSYAPYLPHALVEEDFAFSGRVLSGAEELRERWKRGVALVEGAVGFDIGRHYVRRHFPPEHKARMDTIVAQLIAAYRASIEELDWMTPATREKALAKLEKFTPKIGYPNSWRDYTGLEIDPSDLVASVAAARRFDAAREFAKVGSPIDPDEWHMTPQTVNAYYNPGQNEIVFPAAILQPPFFDPDAEDAVNFGGIGAVVGHEIGHGFDDQGSKYDGDGNLRSWWTSADRTEFERRTGSLIEQFDRLSPREVGDEHTVNGAFTIGENIGDLGGLSIALRAYLMHQEDDADGPPELDGFTGVQRVFWAWATVWRAMNRPQETLRRLATDPHSPAEFRCNIAPGHIDAFYEAFEVDENDAMYIAPAERVRIW
ncbi:MAG: M13-type metalloendopeptidase [Brachybacterium sp.]|nr:M13-type metalloendopeptidase [Brachybacterium sp.]